MVSALCERIRVSQLRWLASPPGTGHQHRHGQRQRASARASVEGRQPCGRKVNPAPIAPRRTLHAAHRVRSQAAQPGQRHDASQRCQRPKAAVEPAPPPRPGVACIVCLQPWLVLFRRGISVEIFVSGQHDDGGLAPKSSCLAPKRATSVRARCGHSSRA